MLSGYKRSDAQGISFKEAFSENEYDSLLQYAQKVSKPVFVYFYSSTCDACNLLSKNVFASSNLALTFNLAFVNIKVGFESEAGIWFFEKYKIQNLPSYFFADMYGKPLNKFFVGMIEIQQLKDIAVSVSGLYSDLMIKKDEYYSNSNDLTIIKQYGFILHQLLYFQEAQNIANTYFKKINSFDYDLYEWQLFKNYFYNINTLLFKRFLIESGKFIELYGKTEVNDYLTHVFDSNFYRSVAEKDSFLLEKSLELLDYFEYRNISTLKVSTLSAKGFFRLEYFRNTGNTIRFLSFLDAFLKENSLPDEILNDYILDVYLIIDDIYWYIKANEWAESLYKSEKSFISTTTYALSFIKLGQKQKAEKLVKKAQKMVLDNQQQKYLDSISGLLK